MELIRGNQFGQIFITDTQEEKLKVLFEGLNAEVKFINIEN